MKRLALILTTCMYASTALAGGSIFGGGGGGSHNRTKNPNGVSSIGVHVCGSLTCPDVIIRKGDCQGINHASVQYGVCLCDDGYHALKGRCVSNDKWVDVKITECQTCDPETPGRVHPGGGPGSHGNRSGSGRRLYRYAGFLGSKTDRI